MDLFDVAFKWHIESSTDDSSNARTGNGTNNILGLGVAGFLKDNDKIIDTSFDILSLEALFLVPRYGGKIIKRGAVTEMTKNILSPEPQPLLRNPVRDSKVWCSDRHVLSVSQTTF